ncbi:MAG TPA: RNA polymerase sigma-70 factor [Bacteroidales bacterium]|jgi:RNA polymerase sigma-70 factor (ECF subfamily)|nr:RNA polymerase sigma-70 factor [Bacteroidales bacterium]HQH24994.1 RNA polymerase sigma-70 factor [Bacteroidales bacterium]HQJ83071.1 RNA polymerase sigma-70 factor [Bacteroidales bacterium]
MRYHSFENEAQLVRNLARGNILAFNTLFREYSGRLYRFAYGYFRSEELSEELVQEVFTRVWANHRSLKSEYSFKSYLFTIAFNIIKKHFRREAYVSEYFKKRIAEEFDLETTRKISYDSLCQYVYGLVDKLPKRRKEIFRKSRFEGLSIKEIAREMKISHKTVENQLTEALKFIRHNINKESF